jgi:hypothetical protein
MWRNYSIVRWCAIGLGLALLMPLGLTPARASGEDDVAEPFRAYYARHDGIRLLGYPVTGLGAADAGWTAQYFEKGRIEDHRDAVGDPNWFFMYGRLTAELMDRDPSGIVNTTDMTYATLRELNDPILRHAPPPNLQVGKTSTIDGVFIPYDPQLRAAPGYYVAPYFWAYINRRDLFPGGWLHDVGLPMTDVFTAQTDKYGKQRTISMQAFERTVLTYDPRNPAGWQVERGNIGSDALRTLDAFGEVYAPYDRVTLPLHMLLRAGDPGQIVTATLRWRDGTTLSQDYRLLRGEDGRGLLIDSLHWMMSSQPPQPRTQNAILDIRNERGVLLGRQTVTVLAADDPGTQTIQLFWVLGEQLQPFARRIPRTDRIGTAALEELLWGPEPPNFAGFETAIPTPQQVLDYPGRNTTWGPRVTLLWLRIENGVATANFSRELAAYGGGSTRVHLIRQQITRTLLQFASVHEVRIAIEGETEGVLEP